MLWSKPRLSHGLPVCSSTSVEPSNAMQWENPACAGISSAVNTVLTCEIMLMCLFCGLFCFHSFDQNLQKSVPYSLSFWGHFHPCFLCVMCISSSFTPYFSVIAKKKCLLTETSEVHLYFSMIYSMSGSSSLQAVLMGTLRTTGAFDLKEIKQTGWE